MGTLPELVESREGIRAVERLFARIALPLAVATEPERMIPLRDLVELFEAAAHITGDPFLGMHVGTQMADKFGIWQRWARSAPSLRGCLDRAARGIRYHQTGTRLALTVAGDEAKFAYHMDLRRPGAGRQHLEHTLPALLAAFRSYGGAAWRPLRIEVDYPADQRLAEVEAWLDIPIHGDAPTMAVVFDADDLDLPLDACESRVPAVTTFDLKALVRGRPPRTTAEVVAEIVRIRLLDGSSDIDGVARRLDTGARTLQRRLESENRPYRQVLAEVRVERARNLLAETAMPITEVALALGYSDQAHFTRAFRRETGHSPSGYRQNWSERTLAG
jgi:AraC-like DNA-binding protein